LKPRARFNFCLFYPNGGFTRLFFGGSALKQEIRALKLLTPAVRRLFELFNCLLCHEETTLVCL
jgi:hypothetical protein